MKYRILDIRGLANLDDGRIDLPEKNNEGEGMELAQSQPDTQNPLEEYSPAELLRLYAQFSHTERVQEELHRRYCNGTLGAVTLPPQLLVIWKERGIL